MNLTQYLERWPTQEGRLFLFGGGKDHDRLSAFYLTCDHWRKQVDAIDFVRLHEPSMVEVAEACRSDPLASRFRCVAATEMKWEDPDEAEEPKVRELRKRQFDSLFRVTNKFPRDLVLIMSTPHENPLTKNDLAQAVIRKGYWVVLKNVDIETASNLLRHLTDWDDELILEVIDSVGTSVADLIAFLKVIRLLTDSPTPEQVRQFVSGYVRAGVFELVDAVINKDESTALRLITDDVVSGQVIGALDRKLTSLVSFIAEMRKGRTPKDAAMALRLPGFIVHGLFEASKRWTANEILSSFEVLARYSVVGDKPGALEMMVHELAA